MRFYREQRRFHCGIDLHASKMEVCVLDDQGNVVLHRNMRAEPEPLKRALAPYRVSLVVGAAAVDQRRRQGAVAGDALRDPGREPL